MADKPALPKPQPVFVLNNEAPRFATRILATVSQDSIVFSFGVENPLNQAEANMHTRIAMTSSVLRSFKVLLDKISSDVDLKKAMQGIQYNQIPSDS